MDWLLVVLVLTGPGTDPFGSIRDDPRAITPEAALAPTNAPEEPETSAEPSFNEIGRDALLPPVAAPSRPLSARTETEQDPTGPELGDLGPRWQLHATTGLAVDTVTFAGASVGLGAGVLWPARHFGVDLRAEVIPMFGVQTVFSDCGGPPSHDCPPTTRTGLPEGRFTLNLRAGDSVRNTFLHLIIPVGVRLTTVWEEEEPVGGAVTMREREHAFYIDAGLGFGLIHRLRRNGLIGFEVTHRAGRRVSNHEWDVLKPMWRASSTFLFFLGLLV